MVESTLQRENSDMVDSFEKLHDNLLCEILSFLPTKCAIRTSILSSRWKSLWTLLPSLDFEGKILSMTESQRLPKGMSFADFVNEVLIIRKGRRIRNFRLSCRGSNCQPHHINTWIRAAIDLNVEELCLSVFLVQKIPLSICLFRCEKLVVLKLTGNFGKIVPPSVCLPSLKVLDMSITFFSDDSFKKLLSGCPVLEELYLHGITYMKPAFKICIPTLKKLDLKFNNIEKEVSKAEINAPSLESLYIRDFNRREYLFENMEKVLKASLSLWVRLRKPDCMFKILNALQSVKSLTLSRRITESLCGVANLDLPEFDKLVYLRFDLISFNWHFLTSLLQKSPNLEVLVIQRTPRGAELYPTLRPCFPLGEESCWTVPSNVPVCLSSHLAEFKFRGFQGLKTAAEMEFVRYVLENSSVLNRVTIQPSKLLKFKQRFDLLRLLSMLPRGSKTCCLEFEQNGYPRGVVIRRIITPRPEDDGFRRPS